MLCKLAYLQTFSIIGNDVELGPIWAFLFDELNWVIRYIVIDPKGEMKDHYILLSPKTIIESDESEKKFSVPFDTKAISNSPVIDLYKDISHLSVDELSDYYQRPVCLIPVPDHPLPPPILLPHKYEEKGTGGSGAEKKFEAETKALPRLRNTREIIGYRINCRDDEAGVVEDFVVEPEETWTNRYFVLDIGNWLKDEKVLISPEWTTTISWPKRMVELDLALDQIKSSPKYDPSIPVSRHHEAKLWEHYGFERYWES